MHALYDVKTSIPTFLYISNAKMHDVNALDLIPYEPGSFYVIDKAYIDLRDCTIFTSSGLSLLHGQKITCGLADVFKPS